MRQAAVANETRSTPMTLREAAFALLAVAGVICPWIFNIGYIAEGGSLTDIGAAADLAFANAVSSSFSADLLIGFAAFAVWVIAEARRIEMRRGWVYPLLGLVVAFAFAFPLFLLLRERHLRTRGAYDAVPWKGEAGRR